MLRWSETRSVGLMMIMMMMMASCLPDRRAERLLFCWDDIRVVVTSIRMIARATTYYSRVGKGKGRGVS